MNPYDAFDELARGAFRGDASHARALFDCCEPRIRGVVERIIHTCRLAWRRYDLSGITQECLTAIWKSRKTYRGSHPGQLWEFIKTIAYRTSAKKPPNLAAPLPDDGLPKNNRPHSDPAPPLEEAEREAVRLCLGRLRDEKPDLYAAVIATDILSLPEREAARVLGIPKNTLGDRKRTGQSWLRQCLEQRGIDHYP
jgi:DNA-directed RNA polymerase specialized sigma24 family protein